MFNKKKGLIVVPLHPKGWSFPTILHMKEFDEIGIPKNSVFYKIDDKGKEILMIKQ